MSRSGDRGEMEDVTFICAHCGSGVREMEVADQGTLEEVRYRHDRRIEPWDHDLELAVGDAERHVCDFCGGSAPQWRYDPGIHPDQDGMYEVEVDADGLSEDEATDAALNALFPWYACDTCSVLVADRNVELLISRAIDAHPVNGDESGVRRRLRASFSVFFSARPGPPHPVA